MISIKFNKTKESRVLKDSKLRDQDTKEEEEETDFVTSVDKKQIHGTKKREEKKELVIPLIAKNEWRLDPKLAAVLDKEQGNDKPEGMEVDKPAPSLSLEDQAIQELLGETRRKDGEEEEDEDNKPLLLQNQVPKGFEEDDNLDVSLRPEQSSLDDYERVPIEEFGMAMLRGMGWSKKEGIGLRNKQHVEMLEPQLRPKGLGLGATLSQQAKKDVQSGSGKGKEEELVFKIGAGAQVLRGAEKGMYGRIEAFDEDNNRVVVKLAISGKMCAVSKFHIELVKESDFKTKSKVLNYDQYAQYKEKQDAKEKERHKTKDRDYEDRVDKESERHQREVNGKDKDRKEKEDKHKSSSSHKKSSSKSSPDLWVRQNLRVRFIDKRYKHGKYYEKKFVVEDVVGPDSFILKSETGSTLLEDITTSQLETVIPKETGKSVCVLRGKRRGRIGELIERNRSAETAVIKIPDEGVYELGYDDICEFLGDPEDYY